MRRLLGVISCSTRKTIPEKSIVIIEVLECFKGSDPILLGQISIPEPKVFPVHFAVDFNDKPITDKLYKGMFVVNAHINTNGKLTFLCEDSVNFVDAKEKLIFDNVNLKLTQK